MLALDFSGVKFVTVIVAVEAAPLDTKIINSHLQTLAFLVLFSRVRAKRAYCVVLAAGVFGQADVAGRTEV
jgi:hypothetical protein